MHLPNAECHPDPPETIRLLEAIGELGEMSLSSASSAEILACLLNRLLEATGAVWGIAGCKTPLDEKWTWIAADRRRGPDALPLRDGIPPGVDIFRHECHHGSQRLAWRELDTPLIPASPFPSIHRGLCGCIGSGGGHLARVLLFDPPCRPEETTENLARHMLDFAGRALLRRHELVSQWKVQADYKLLFDRMQEGFALLQIVSDPQGAIVDFRFLDVNNAFEALTGVKGDDCIGRTIGNLFPVNPHPWWFATLQAVARDGLSRQFVERFPTEGRDFLFEVQIFRPEPGRIACTFLDVSERIHAEELLRRSAAKYRSIFENIQDIYFELSLDDLLLEVSPSVEQLLQYSREELLGTNISHLFAREGERERVREALLTHWRITDWEIELRNREGAILWCAVSAKLMFREDGQPDRICGILRDITLRKRQELALRRSEARLRQIIDLVPHPIFARDASGRYLLANKALARFHGTTVEQIIGKRAHDLGPDREVWDQLCKVDHEVIASGLPISVPEVRIERPDGEVCYFQTAKVPFDQLADGTRAVLGIAIDITERRQSELERARLAMAAEQAAEAIVITDADGHIQYVNPAFERLTGYTLDECRGHTPSLLKSGRHHASFYQEMWQTLLAGTPWTGHLINRRKDGSLYEEDATIAPVRDASGRIVNYIAVKRDVSREVQLQERLRQAQKMESIGTLAGGIAHDFNNILSAIVGYTELVANQLPAESRARGHLDQVLIAGQRARDLVKQILTFSRQVESERKPVQIQLIVKEALKLLRATLPATIEIRQILEDETGTALADPTQVHQLIMNLCTNAYQAMIEKGGLLEVRLRAQRIDAPSSATELAPGDYLLLSISDTGVGMTRQTIQRIFDPFFTTKEKGGGTGLGLATVHGIVAAMQGAITVYSEPGAGSRFNVYLPRIASETPQPSAAPNAIPGGAGERILWVDDEKAILQFGRELLERLGYRVTTAAGSVEGLEVFRLDPMGFDLVITDQTMPKMTGAQLAAEILRIRPGMPILLSTGFSETLTADQIDSLGIRFLIEKPFTLGDMAQAVRKALGQA